MTSAPTTPTEARLPGLDVEVAEPQTKPSHWLERGNPKRLMVFSGRSHPELARRISEHLGVELGEIELHTFGNGETYCRYDESIRGADLFLVQTGCHPVDHMTALPLFARHFRDLGFQGDGVVSVAPDAEWAKVAARFGEMLEADFAMMNKSAPAHDVAAVTEVTGRVRDKIALVGDDVIMTGETLLAAAQALREDGATAVWVFATHAIFAGNSLAEFAAADLTGIVVTDTVPVDPIARPQNMTVLPIAGLLAETIGNVFADDSVSAIFGGDTQLF